MDPRSFLTALLCVAVAAPQLQVSQAACSDVQFQCANGDCIPLELLCSGRNDCKDNSNNDASKCNAAPTTAVNVGDTVTVKAQFKVQHKAVRFNLCDDSSCNLIWIHKLLLDGAFGSSTWTECNSQGWWCQPITEIWPGPDDNLPAGELVFEVKREASAMIVWISGYPEHKVTLPAKPTYNRLVVRPFFGNEPMPVEFARICESDSAQYKCTDGSCVSVWSKCDGIRDCEDGSDESDGLCDAPIVTLYIGEVMTVRAQHNEKHGHVDVSLCDSVFCNTIALYGSTPQGAPWFFSWTDCNARGGNCKAGVEVFPIGREYFPSGEVVLKVLRRPSELSVWLDGHPEYVANVTVGEGYSHLRVRPIF